MFPTRGPKILPTFHPRLLALFKVNVFAPGVSETLSTTNALSGSWFT